MVAARCCYQTNNLHPSYQQSDHFGSWYTVSEAVEEWRNLMDTQGLAEWVHLTHNAAFMSSSERQLTTQLFFQSADRLVVVFLCHTGFNCMHCLREVVVSEGNWRFPPWWRSVENTVQNLLLEDIHENLSIALTLAVVYPSDYQVSFSSPQNAYNNIHYDISQDNSYRLLFIATDST